MPERPEIQDIDYTIENSEAVGILFKLKIMKKFSFNIEHGLFNTNYTFVFSQYKQKKYCQLGDIYPLHTQVDLFINNDLVESKVITKHVNDKDQPKLAFYKVLDKLVSNRFTAYKSLRTKIYTKFRYEFDKLACFQELQTT